jgi:hypothetical protein
LTATITIKTIRRTNAINKESFAGFIRLDLNIGTKTMTNPVRQISKNTKKNNISCSPLFLPAFIRLPFFLIIHLNSKKLRLIWGKQKGLKRFKSSPCGSSYAYYPISVKN